MKIEKPIQPIPIEKKVFEYTLSIKDEKQPLGWLCVSVLANSENDMFSELLLQKGITLENTYYCIEHRRFLA